MTAGPGESLRRMSAWLTNRTARGCCRCPTPTHAAEMFTGMVLGHGHLRAVLGLDHPEVDIEGPRPRNRPRFIRAFAV
jgi:TetR/AcrR family transcriptional repressor of mexJK operon